MGAACPEPSRSQEIRCWQFSLRQMLAATTAVDTVLGLAVWGGWVRSDAVVYLSIAVVVAVFSSTARRALLGGCVILGTFCLAMVLGEIAFGPSGRFTPNPLSFWIFAGLLTLSAMILRRFTKAGAFSLAASLVLAEVFAAIAIVYTYGCPTLFQAFQGEHRESVLRHLLIWFPIFPQWLIVAPWLIGIALGELLNRHKKGGGR